MEKPLACQNLGLKPNGARLDGRNALLVRRKPTTSGVLGEEFGFLKGLKMMPQAVQASAYRPSCATHDKRDGPYECDIEERNNSRWPKSLHLQAPLIASSPLDLGCHRGHRGGASSASKEASCSSQARDGVCRRRTQRFQRRMASSLPAGRIFSASAKQCSARSSSGNTA